jgi:hypothetical protein
MKLTSKSSFTVTENTYNFRIEGEDIIYTEILNDKGKVIDYSLKDSSGSACNSDETLERVQNFVDSIENDPQN